MTTALPWGAVGFLDNGCTAALIDSQHVLAASHCFTFDYDGTEAGGTPYSQGAWQRGLVFFPNYHPARTNPPRVQIDRAIVGSRVQSDPNAAADWGIAHLAGPVSGFAALDLAPMARWQYPSFVRFAGYARDDTVYPNKAASYPEPAPGGYCANFKGNCWWIPALVDPKCLAIEEENGIVRVDNFSCLVQGGNSGSPVVWNAGNATTHNWRVTGLISGGGAFWSAKRFEHAPRYAADIAVGSYDDGTQRTQVFATDRDRARVVSRYRVDTTVSGSFTYFRDLGEVPGPGPIAAVDLDTGKPLVVVAGTTAMLATNRVGPSGAWQGWQKISGPSGPKGVLDLAATTDKSGVAQLYLVGSDFQLYTSGASNASASLTWGQWTKVYMGADAQRVSAVRHGDGRQQVFVVTTTGAVRSLWQSATTPGSAWSKPITLSTGQLPPLVDITAGWTPDGRVQIFAIDNAGSGWTRSISGSSPQAAWGAWSAWSIPLYAPSAASPPALAGIVSLSAGRWRESSANTVPVVFATDDQGNIYLTTYENGNWKASRSFYN